MSTFGERLKLAFANASNAEIARKIGVSEPAVKNYLDGRVPDSGKLLHIAALTNCNLHWLLTGDEIPTMADPPAIDFDLSIRTVIREVVREELMAAAVPTQELGSVDEFDIEAAVKKYDNALPVLRDWYTHEGLEVPEIGALSFSGWSSMTLAEKVNEIRAVRGIMDRQRERRSLYASTKPKPS